MKGIVNTQSSEVYKINAGIHKGSCLGSTLLGLNINNLPRNILRSLVNNYTDDTTVYECTFKNQDNQSLESNLPSNLALTVK